jgi:CBS domain-containing protein
MKIREIMVTEIQAAEPDDTLEDVAVMMRDNDVGAIPVVEDGELIGIITDRDIVVRCVAEGRDPAEVAADEVISGDLQTIAPEAGIDEARRMMGDSQIRRLPVVEGGRLVGMLSLGDLAVKTGQEEEIAKALEDISDGVKATGQGAPRELPAGTRKQPKPVSSSSRQSAASNSPGQKPAGAQSRIDEQSRGDVDRKQRTGGRAQGISSHAAGEEVKRQNRVVPIRTQQKTNVRGQKGGKGPSGRKAG